MKAMTIALPGRTVLLWLSLAMCAQAQPGGGLAPADRAFVSHDRPHVAITGATLIDGTGAPARHGVTVLVSGGRIAAVGPRAEVPIPAGTTVIDGTGKTVLPGFVMMHEHLFYPDGKGGYRTYPEQFARLYLASGATTIRTAGSLDPYADLAISRAIGEGRRIGPDMDVTGPYIDGHPKLDRFPSATGPEAARKLVDYWADEGVTSYKVYEHVSHDELLATIGAAHARGLKVTGHICSVTYAEAAAAGLDNIEHSFSQASDFVADRAPGSCPDWIARAESLAALDPKGPEARRLIRLLVDRRVALTSTLPVTESLTRGRAPPSDEMLAPLSAALRGRFLAALERVQASSMMTAMTDLVPNLLRLEREFVAAGGLLLAGSDPTSLGGIVPGSTVERQLHLMLEGGFALPEAIRVMTLNGATYLGRDRDIGSVAAGKRADLVVLQGDLSRDRDAIGRVLTVFKQGVGYDAAAIKAASAGQVGVD